MKLQMNAVNFAADEKLLDFIQERTNKLDTFYDKIQDGEVFLKLEKGENPKENKMVEIKLNISGARVFAKEISNSFEAATDASVESLRRQIKKHKEKLYAKH